MLILIFLISAIFALSGYQPLTLAGIFFGTCYLLGLALFAVLKKESLRMEDLVLAFPASIGISSLATVGLLYAGVQVKFIAYIIYGITCLTLLFYIIKYRKTPSLTITLSWEEIRFISVAFLTTLIFSIPVISERISISAHGFHHSTMITQILNGIFPPENPGLGGTALSYHWGHHALVAALSSPTDFNPLRIISILNVMSLFFIFCIAYRTAKLIDFTEGYAYLVPLALIGLMRSDALIFFAHKLFSENLMKITDSALTEMRPLDVLQNWVWGGGAPWFDRRLFFLNKFYNANTMPLGIALCLSYFFVFLIHIKNTLEHTHDKICPTALGLTITACCIIYPPLAIILLLHAPAYAGFDFLSQRAEFKTRFREMLKIMAPYGIAVVIVLPYLRSISSHTGEEPIIRVEFWDQSIRNLVAFWLPMPLILAGVLYSFRKIPLRFYLFLILSASLCFGLSTFTQVVLWNSDKFTFILSFFYALFFVTAISSLMKLLPSRELKTIFLALVIVFLLVTPILTEAAFLVTPWFRDNTYSFSGRHIIFNQDRKRNEAYTWIRDNTPPEALVLLTYVTTSDPDDIAQNSTYEPAALMERNLFIIKDWYTFPNPEYDKRVNIREKLFLNYRDPRVKDFFKAFNRPFYLLTEDRLPPVYLKDEMFSRFPYNPEGFELVFENERQRVFRMKINERDQ